MKWTGERCVPEDLRHMPWIYTYSLMRYAFATQYCGNKRVLDIACGTGYGMQVISPVCIEISGGDIDEESLVKTRLSKTNKTKFIKKIDLNTQTIADVFKQQFDVIISFETIEHLDNPNFFLNSIRDSLVHGGYFIFSVPVLNGDKFHKVIFSYDQALNLCNNLFPYQRIVIQRFETLIGMNEIPDPEVLLPQEFGKVGTSIIKVMGDLNDNTL